jgi:hypothetical protein
MRQVHLRAIASRVRAQALYRNAKWRRLRLGVSHNAAKGIRVDLLACLSFQGEIES